MVNSRPSSVLGILFSLSCCGLGLVLPARSQTEPPHAIVLHAARARQLFELKAQDFRRQVAAGVPMAVGSDVGPFPHGTQAREFELMVKNGMTPLAVLQADLLNGAKLLGWEGQIGALKPGYLADVIAVPGNPLQDISALKQVTFVMKGGVVYRKP
jgi:imidazolonepropionase-like amidohydrolase